MTYRANLALPRPCLTLHTLRKAKTTNFNPGEIIMKSRFVRVSLFLFTGLVALQLWAGQLNQSGKQVFTGEVTDTFCAPNKSHEVMMNENKTMGREKQTCTQRCVQIGAKYVLIDA